MTITDLIPQAKLAIASVKVYIYGALFLTIAGLISLHAIDLGRIHTAEANLATANVKLSVSNTSVKSLTNRLNGVTLDLSNIQKADKAREDATGKELVAQDVKNKGRIDLETKLRGRKTVVNCATPKDLQDAWNTITH